MCPNSRSACLTASQTSLRRYRTDISNLTCLNKPPIVPQPPPSHPGNPILPVVHVKTLAAFLGLLFFLLHHLWSGANPGGPPAQSDHCSPSHCHHGVPSDHHFSLGFSQWPPSGFPSLPLLCFQSLLHPAARVILLALNRIDLKPSSDFPFGS